MNVARGGRVWRHRPRGQGLVEFALVLPLFLLLVFAVIDGGRYVFLNSTLSNAAREGARVGSVEASWMGSSDPSCGTLAGPVCPSNFAALKTDIGGAAQRLMSPFGTPSNVYVSCDPASGSGPTGAWASASCSNPSPGNIVSVRVTYTWRAITPIISNIMGNINTSASATVLIN